MSAALDRAHPTDDEDDPEFFKEQARQEQPHLGNGAAAAPMLVGIDPSRFEGLAVPQRVWRVQDWIPARRVTGLYGAGGEGKTLLAQQLMTAAAINKPWIGQPVERMCTVGLFCEDDEEEMRIRQHDINRLYGCSWSDLGRMTWVPRLGEDNMLMTFDGPRGKATPLFDALLEMARGVRAEIVVVDTVADTFGGNENDRGQVRQFVQACLGRLARETGAAVLALAHPSRGGQNTGTGEGGSTGWNAAFRSRLYLETPKPENDALADPDARVLTRKKANYARRDETINLTWANGVLTSRRDECDPPPPCDVVFLDLLDQTTVEGISVSHSLNAGNYAPKVFSIRPGRRGYKKADFASAMHLLLDAREITIGEYGRSGDIHKRLVRVTQ
jgi:archaellum biogenesis ATPase FlaH